MRLHVPNAGDKNLILGQGTKISRAQPCRLKKIKLKKKKKKKKKHVLFLHVPERKVTEMLKFLFQIPLLLK